MLLAERKSKIIEKILRRADGRLFKAFILVTEYEGKLYFKIISAIECNDCGERKNNCLDSKNLCLTGKTVVISPYSINLNNTSRNSFYINGRDQRLFNQFFISAQMTRAPGN